MQAHEDTEKEYVNQQLESTLDSVDRADSLIMDAATAAGFPEDDLHKIGMATRECMVNAVVHGNRYNANKTVHLQVSGTGDYLKIRITDQGEGFDPASLPDPLAEENLLRHSGRGIFLIRAFMDDVQVKPVSPHGTEVLLLKKKSVSD
jgi:serine/threonine-protein kinase RsbW